MDSWTILPQNSLGFILARFPSRDNIHRGALLANEEKPRE